MSASFLGPDLALLLGDVRPIPGLPQSLDSGQQAPRQAPTEQPAAAQVGGSLTLSNGNLSLVIPCLALRWCF